MFAEPALDLGLPGKSGYEVARELRTETPFARLVIAAVTGDGQEEDRQKSRVAGFDYHCIEHDQCFRMRSFAASGSGPTKTCL